MARILICEDEEGIASFLDKGLTAAGHATMVVNDGKVAAAVARDDAFDLVLLDLGLPTVEGISVLRQLRARGDKMPVIILTARDDLDSTLAGFDGGANDYMTKPFQFEELMARVNVRLAEAARGSVSQSDSITIDDATLDIGARTLTVGDKVSELSAKEFALAKTFFTHAGQVLSREQLLSRVWGYDFDPGSNVVDVYVGYLRKKMGSVKIETVRGVGYRLKGS